jgi:ribonucleoside-triphosphate reductase
MTKRLKIIFSVLASKSRLEIIRILAAKGGMTYTELKEASGFTPKRESGKFAYHLKKLVQQNLVVQNKQERKYMITPLGRLVLSLAKQIEEESLVSSGRLYVRESSQRIEEFDTSKIVQSLIKEANVPLEVAQNIASEAESRIYKFQLTYLTSPLIREVVNSILLEQGLEQYWKKLSRLGMPVYDLEVMLDETSKEGEGFEDVVYKAAERIFSDYLVRSDLPTDLIDAHFNGKIHLSFPENWMFKPDVIALDLNLLDGIANKESLTFENFIKLVYGLSREANAEVFIKINEPMIEKLKKESFFMLQSLLPSTTRSPVLTIHVDKVDDEIINEYNRFLLKVKKPKVLLSTNMKVQAPLLLVNNDNKTSIGFKLNEEKGLEIGIISASINLPHLANEAQNEESYFKVKVLLLKDILQDAITQKNKLINNRLLMGLLPTLKELAVKHPSEYISPLVNLAGLKESMIMLNINQEDVIKKEIELINLLQEKIGYPVSWIQDDSGERLAHLDSQKLGKRFSLRPYSLGLEIYDENNFNEQEIKELNKHLRGGLRLTLGFHINEKTTYLYKEKEVKCKKCGWNNPISLKNCRNCGYPLEPTKPSF